MARVPKLLPLLLAPALLAAAPSDLAPGAPELQEAEARLDALLAADRAVAVATTRLQEAWAIPAWVAPPPPPPPKPGAKPVDLSRDVVLLTHIEKPPLDACADADRLRLGWSVERYGAAWREATQAVRAQAARVAVLRRAPTVSPLVDDPWAARLDAQALAAERATHDLQVASAWQATFVRPLLERCPAPVLVPRPGVGRDPPRAGDEVAPAVAVLAMGEGWVCPAAERADDAVVLVRTGEACWSEATPCACTPEPVLPGAVLGRIPDPPDPDAPLAPASPLATP